MLVVDSDDDVPVISSRRIAVIAFWLLALYGVVNFVDVWLASRSSYEGTSTAAVVLGAAQYNGEPSAALQGRLDRAAELYTNDRVELVVVTGGGQAADITTEAKTGYDYLRDTASIPDEDLRLEVDGTSTYQSLAAAARFLSDEGIDDVIIVTDPYHAKRSKLIAEEVGLIAEVAPTDSSTSFGRLLRESAGTAVGRLLGFRRVDAYVDV
jgi:vancomycin permeability regulator SanA